MFPTEVKGLCQENNVLPIPGVMSDLMQVLIMLVKKSQASYKVV